MGAAFSSGPPWPPHPGKLQSLWHWGGCAWSLLPLGSFVLISAQAIVARPSGICKLSNDIDSCMKSDSESLNFLLSDPWPLPILRPLSTGSNCKFTGFHGISQHVMSLAVMWVHWSGSALYANPFLARDWSSLSLSKDDGTGPAVSKSKSP